MKIIPVHRLPNIKPMAGFHLIEWSTKSPAQEASLPHRHDYFEMLFFLEGKGKHEIEFVEFDFHPVSVHLVAASTVHAVKREKGSRGFSLLFSPEFLLSNMLSDLHALYHPNFPPTLSCPSTDFETIQPVTQWIRSEFHGENPRKRQRLQLLLHLLITQLLELREKQPKQNERSFQKNAFAIQLEKLIEENYQKHWRASDYAEAMRTSVTHLNAQCKQHFSKSTQELLQDRMLLEIKRLLAHSDLPVKEICFHLNFEDPGYFNRFFKKHTGTTPQEFRKALNT